MRALLPFLVGVAITPLASAQHPRNRPPIIDVHLHAYTAAEWTSRPPNPATGQLAPASATDHMRACLAAMERYNIVAAIVSGPLEAVETWRRGAPGRILGSPLFGRPGFDLFGRPLPALDSLRTLYRGRQLKAMAEVTAQYEGLSPSDTLLDPYFALAEELDVPVGIHTGTSFPGTPYSGFPQFRVALGNPLLLEDLLVRHPKLRVYIMHGGEPWRRETIALMKMYPQVYMDVAVIDWIGGRNSKPRFHEFLREMLTNGLGKRIMFGTDQMRWPEAIGMAIEFVESAAFLSPGEKRDILYNNAARFGARYTKQVKGDHYASLLTDFWRAVWAHCRGSSAPALPSLVGGPCRIHGTLVGLVDWTCARWWTQRLGPATDASYSSQGLGGRTPGLRARDSRK